MQDDAVALFAYDRWANTKVLDACRKLSAEQYVADPVAGWSSVRSTIYHIALATEWNLRTLACDPDDSIPTEADLATVDDAARLLERAYRRFEDLRLTLTPERLNTVLTLRRQASRCCRRICTLSDSTGPHHFISVRLSALATRALQPAYRVPKLQAERPYSWSMERLVALQNEQKTRGQRLHSHVRRAVFGSKE